MKELKVRLTFLEEVLGTANAEKDIHEKFIASKAPDAPSREQEVEALGIEEVVEKGRTVFPKDDNGNPFLWDYRSEDSLSQLHRPVPISVEQRNLQLIRKKLTYWYL